MTEVWKSVKGYEGLYEVSDLGRVKSLGNGETHKTEHIMRTSRNCNGYVLVHLTKNGITKTFQLHRIVASAFIENEDKKPCVDHIDTNVENNRADNLRWCTDQENNLNPITREHKSLSKRGENNPNHKSKLVGERLARFNEAHKKRTETISRPVNQISNGVVVATYRSAKDASTATGITSSNISRCCNLIRKTAGGYEWTFA